MPEQTPHPSPPRVADTASDSRRMFSDMQAQSLKALTVMNAAWYDALSATGRDVMRFVADQSAEDIRTQHRMLHCKTPAELQQVQAAFLWTALEQYQAETGKLINCGRDVFRAALDQDRQTT